MALPKAIQDQMDAADAIQQQLYPETPDVGAPNGDTQAAPAPAPEPVAPAPVAAVPAEPQQSQPAPIPAPAQEDFEAQYKTIRGKYQAEVPRLHAEVQSLRTQLQAVQRAPEAPVAPVREAPLVSKEDVDNFGSDLVGFIDRLASAKALAAVNALEARLRSEFGAVQGKVAQVEQRVVQSAEQVFWGEVVRLVPDWAVVNEDPRWMDWLDTAPEFSVLTYRQIAQSAIDSADAAKIAKLSEEWKKTLPKAPAAPTAPVLTPQQELARQQAPTSSRASTPVAAAAKIWSKADYDAAYDPRNVRLYGQAQADQLQADADLAVAEGRIRW